MLLLASTRERPARFLNTLQCIGYSSPKQLIIQPKMSIVLRCTNNAYTHCHRKASQWLWESSVIVFLFPTTELTGRRNKSAIMGLKDCRVLPLAINQ